MGIEELQEEGGSSRRLKGAMWAGRTTSVERDAVDVLSSQMNTWVERDDHGFTRLTISDSGGAIKIVD
jgi:hypothetical protein